MSSYTRPTISAIVVNFNAGGFLELCIDRIRKSTPAVELIVVDNYSKDISKVWAIGCNSRQS
ncbi:MAG: glycosyltransferase, partial [Pseudomonadota bacterium]|nr:glycosyltransferase [Pseudomonadota bacterium]